MSTTATGSESTINPWMLGARPKTLPASVVPVIIGTGLAIHVDGFVWWRALMCLAIALAMQVGVNYANDYSDGVRGTDEERVGPTRLVASGLKPAHAVKRAAFLSLGVGALLGLALSLIVNPWLLLIGAACLAGAWFYTGGKRPYGYSGFGELAVFVFFGLVATIGTAYLQAEHVTFKMVLGGCAAGLFAVALLIVNNLRDIPGDTASGKRTMAVRLGDSATRGFYVTTIVLAYVIVIVLAPFQPFVLLALVSLPLAVAAVRPVVRGAAGRDLIAVLGATGRTQLAFGFLFAVGIAI